MSVSSDTHREDILRAAISEFGRVGYTAASTNEIIKQAKVSKGLLFHHFTNKEKLYAACHTYVLKKFGQLLAEQIDFSITDFFERVLYSFKLKMELGSRYPELLAFVNRAWYFDEDKFPVDRNELKALVVEMVGEQGASFIALEGVDTSKLNEKYEFVKILDYIRLILDATWMRFSRKHHNDIHSMLADLNSYITEVEEIVTMFRDGVYSK